MATWFQSLKSLVATPTPVSSDCETEVKTIMATFGPCSFISKNGSYQCNCGVGSSLATTAAGVDLGTQCLDCGHPLADHAGYGKGITPFHPSLMI